MTLRRLRTLIAIAETKTFTQAAERVHVTHAAVSQQMQTLEADLGVQLFDRSARTPTLTPLALQVVEKARRLTADYDALIPSILDDGGLKGVVTLGVLRTTLTGLVPKAMSLLKSKYPDIGLHVRPGLTAPLLAEIERGHLDAAILTKTPLRPDGVVFREIAVEPLHVIAAQEEPEDDPATLLHSRPFIRFDRTAIVGALIDDWLVAKRIKVSETMELDSPEAIASMVRANLGVSIVPKPAVPPMDPIPLKHISLGPNAPSRQLVFAHAEKSIKMRALDELYDTLRGVAGTT